MRTSDFQYFLSRRGLRIPEIRLDLTGNPASFFAGGNYRLSRRSAATLLRHSLQQTVTADECVVDHAHQMSTNEQYDGDCTRQVQQ
jgi:hypothetical protein